MKGRRKVKSDRWSKKLQLEVYARELLQGRSDKQGRFIDIAVKSGKNAEPVGRLAG
ncbi:Inositol monophosphatase/fructose-1,6-bisphosphatase family protein (plasmid) [Pseudomonas putida]|uniref:Inositol monophosphatase/fructose-1,6-bisphosphatase family protein n=1 Tax=Pseudomonas putida TaxID=303 RepID=A0A1L7NNF4_PSEPU|nr:Inositol monophosphatase/fructose-1,6-bisphosphatase family protein [Pseudomonas putida]